MKMSQKLFLGITLIVLSSIILGVALFGGEEEFVGCPEGYTLDTQTQECIIPVVPPSTTPVVPLVTTPAPKVPDCPEGFQWSGSSGRCVITDIAQECEAGYVIHPRWPEYGCMPLEDAKMLSLTGATIGGIPIYLLALAGLIVVVFMYRSKKRGK